MRYTRVYSVVHVVGRIWMPGIICGQDVQLTDHDVDTIRGDKPFSEITREDVADWLATHAGDFSQIIDFNASLSVGSEDVEIPWATEEGELTYYDAMSPPEDME